MSNIINRYLTREILKTSAATVLVLFGILMSNALGRVLADITDGEIPHQALWPVMLSQSVNLLSLLLPVGVFLGIIFALGRMSKDHEIVVMNACGISYRDFYKPVAMVLIPVFLICAYASIWLNSQSLRSARAMIMQEKNLNEFELIKPGQFNQSKGGDLVFYMESISADKLELQGIIISQNMGDTKVLETAKSGRQKIDDKTGNLFLVVGPGERYQGKAGQKKFNIIDFEQHGILIEGNNKPASFAVKSEEKTIRELWFSNEKDHRIELHWRIAMPMVLLVLGILAVPLSYIAPRQGRFGKVGYALLVYFAYLNLMVITRAQLEAGSFPMALNFWGVHLIFIALAVALLYRRDHGLFFRKNRTAG